MNLNIFDKLFDFCITQFYKCIVYII